MKSLLIISSSIIVSAISLKRLMVSDSMFELLFRVFLAVLFGTFSLYLIFEKSLKKLSIFDIFNRLINDNKIMMHYVALIIGLAVMEVLFYFYTPNSSAINTLRLFLMFFFALGIIILIIHIFRIKQSENRSTS